MSRRKRRIWITVLSTVIGIIAFTIFALWLAGIRDTDLTNPTDGVTTRFKNDEAITPIKFQNVAEEIGVVFRHGPGKRGRTLPEDTGSGVAWGDYDGDGDWDIYMVNFPGPLGGEVDISEHNHLFRNDGDHFTDVTNKAGVADTKGFGMGATFIDYDNDGDVDIYVTNYGVNRLYQNHGDGTFEDVASRVGVADPLWSTGVAWGDFDRDGHIDLYVCNYVDFENSGIEQKTLRGTGSIPFTLNPNSFDPQPNRLYRNRGDGTFEDATMACGVENSDGRSLAATFCDFDGDGWLDLYINNDVSANKLYQNMGNDGVGGHVVFADISAITGTADPRGSMGLSVGEIGGMTGEPDGLPDLFITHWIAQENAFYQSLMTTGNTLEYRDKTRHFRLGEISIDMVGWGCAITDFDLDGKPDIAVANGSTLEEKEDPLYLKAEPVFVFWNDGERFYNVAAQTGASLSEEYWGRGLAVADFDRDGDVDIAIMVNRGRPLILRNNTETKNHSLVVTLAGSAAVCFGAKVEMVIKGSLQVQWWGADVTFLGMHAAELVFGLGKNTSIDKVVVHWVDGKTSELTNVPSGRVDIFHPDYKKNKGVSHE